MAYRVYSRSAHQVLDITPPALLALLYAALVLLGAVLLKLPIASQVPVSWSDALFTATSAVTVTGLVVVDTGTDLAFFGQTIVLVLIQLGGLGLMTFAVLILRALGLAIRVPHQILLREDLNQTSIAELFRLVAVIAQLVLVCEVIGTLLLLLVFVPEFGWAKGAWHAVFHSVSAFNNAGFSLFPDSLSRWVTNPLINGLVPALFIIGGLGFVVLGDIRFGAGWRAYSLHTKLTLSGSVALIVSATVAFAILEWSNPGTLGQLPGAGAKLTASWFQSVTPRTAGFNTIDIGAVHDSTALMLVLLMLIGAGSTSTAGGIKVTTFLVLLLATVAFFKGRRTLRAFGRSLGFEEVLKVLALTTLSLLIVMTGIFAITLSHDGDFLDLTFEVASAFGTVGLSRGATAELDQLGRLVIMVTMFVGRVGPLTLGFLLARSIAPKVRYPSGQIFLG